MQKYVFLLGREPLLSLSELKSVFDNISQKGDFALIESTEEDIKMRQNSLGGTIKIGHVLSEGVTRNELLGLVVGKIKSKIQENKKLRIGIDSFTPSLNSLVFKAKDKLREMGASIRVVQHDKGRIKNATTIHEKLIKQGIELMIYPDGNGFTVAETIWIQDIEGYSERDMKRDRSMVVGMMPPKIAQIMINLATKGDKKVAIWDPFCGLGTTLIEAFHGGWKCLYGSDLSQDMVNTTQKNMKAQIGMDDSHAEYRIFPLDAKNIELYNIDGNECVIVTEGMLGTNFTPRTITQQGVLEERKKLTELYSAALLSSHKNQAIKRIAICLPFWNVGKDTIFMPEITLLSKHWTVSPLCVSGRRYMVHMRPGQSVGREIVLLERQ